MTGLEKKLGSIAIMMDDRISREKQQILTRAINALRAQAHVTVLSGQTSEDILIEKLEDKAYHVVLIPWHRYVEWTRAEAFYGLARTSGPAFAGYFADRIRPHELGAMKDNHRAMIFDFANLSVPEILNLVGALSKDQLRSGLRPLIDPATQVYCENWFSPQGHGARIDGILGLPEIAQADWARRAPALRICLQALWSLVFEEGPGKADFAQNAGGKAPKAYFQFAADKSILGFRLCFPMPAWTPKSAVKAFWQDPSQPTAAAQLLMRFADLVRVHMIAETPDVEVTALFFPSAPAEKSPECARTLWVEPLSPQAVLEIPFEAPGPASPHLRALPGFQVVSQTKPLASHAPAGSSAIAALADDQAARERFIFNAALKIKELKRAIDQKDETIRELRSGGVGIAAPLPPPDAESLLQAFQERYFDAKFQIRQIEKQIEEARKNGATPQTIDNLKQRMSQLARKEEQWIQLLGEALETLRQARKIG